MFWDFNCYTGASVFFTGYRKSKLAVVVKIQPIVYVVQSGTVESGRFQIFLNAPEFLFLHSFSIISYLQDDRMIRLRYCNTDFHKLFRLADTMMNDVLDKRLEHQLQNFIVHYSRIHVCHNCEVLEPFPHDLQVIFSEVQFLP
ncbi:hypothetical protein SDC9_67411 [bioreactor metagenome]|uniref:Uncharacterized protein n=1 Tax=bioreactor metagenome TaxID=1076179 RepID=A0A644XXI8_9ZZZZ